MKSIEGMTVFEFTDLNNAQNFADQAIEPMQILLGDYPHYWVTTIGTAERLVALGYEFLPRELLSVDKAKIGL
jgi:hypothetical protein